MPSVSKAQEDFFRAVSHSRAFAKKVKVPQKVGKDFESADKAKGSKADRLYKKKDKA